MDRGGRIIVGALLAALVASWALFGTYQWSWLPIQRQKALLHVGGLVYERGQVVLIGDSILAALPECEGALNLAVPGSLATQPEAAYAAAMAARSPARVLVLIGINDILRGGTPADVARAIGDFVQELRRRLRQTTITVLSILPVADNAAGVAVSNSAIA